MEPPLLPLTHDWPIISKVAPWLTASQGIDYRSMASTTSFSHYQDGVHRCMERRICVDTLYVVITAQVSLQMYILGGQSITNC